MKPTPSAIRFPVPAAFVSVIATAALLAVAAAPPTPTNAPPENLAALRERLAAHVTQARFQQAHWGLQIVASGSGQTVFAHHAGQLFIPASNTKLYTGALALDRLGPDFRIRTSLLAKSRPNGHGTLGGDLIVFGRGDPTWAARFHQGSLDRALDPLIAAVKAAGIRQIQGGLVADESFFPGAPLGSGWDWDDLQFAYGAEVSALTLNDNALDVLVKPAAVPGRPAVVTLQPPTSFVIVSNGCVTAPPDARRSVHVVRPLNRNVLWVTGQIPVGDAGHTESVSVHQPAAWFGHLFREALRRNGVHVHGKVQTVDAAEGASPLHTSTGLEELGAVESPPLRDLLARMLKPSQNLYAQLLLLQVGVAELERVRHESARSPAAGPGATATTTAEEAGIRALNTFLGDAGIPPGEALFEEGSGLARRNLVTPAATVRLLQYMERHRHAEVFRTALPVAGVDGTLRSRMKGTPAEGNARAKTGTLSYVYSLSGYVTSAAGERFTFSLMLNNYRNTDPNRSARAELDDVVVMLASLPWRTGLEARP